MNVQEAIKQGLIDYDDRPEGIEKIVLDHGFVGVAGHPDDDECTDRWDGTDATYCGRPEAAHVAPRTAKPVAGPRGFEVGVHTGRYFDGYGPGGESRG